MSRNKALVETLVENNLLPTDQAKSLLENGRPTSLKKILSSTGMEPEECRRFLKKQFNLSYINIDSFEPRLELTKYITKFMWQKYRVVPVQVVNNALVVAAFELLSDIDVQTIEHSVGLKVQIVLAEEKSMKAFSQKLYFSVDEGSLADDLKAEVTEHSVVSSTDMGEQVLDIAGKSAQDGAVIDFVNKMIQVAVVEQASDIHVENYEKKFRVRYRMDGVLREKFNLDRSIAPAIVSRIKILSRMNIAEKRKPQDGRLRVKLSGEKVVDFRVNSIPTLFGEKVVMRVLDKSNLQVDMKDLGMEEEQLKKLIEAVSSPQGMILVTGPTGSGKTTTLYSALNQLNTEDRNISTAEDPIEFNFEGINQVQVNPVIQFNFSHALRAFLRQDPEVIMIGEVRDAETADIAFKAAATGHLVLSTLHTNDAVASVGRLVDIGVPTYIITDSTSLVVAQRLVRTICKNCIFDETLADAALDALGVKEKDREEYRYVKKGKGCGRCNQSGLSGRQAIFEVLDFSPSFKAALMSGVTGADLKLQAVKDGLITLRQHALLKMKAGIIPSSEVFNMTVNN